MSDALEVIGLRKTFGSTVALDDVSLKIPEGSIVGLLGPNGAGKTTLMKVVLGLVRADAGRVRFGSDLGRPSKGTIGALIERPGFYPYLTARRNLEALGLTAGMTRDALDDAVKGALERVDLRNAADRKFGQFSTGMKQRLGIAAALLGSPTLIILDEPVSGLDPAAVAAIRRLMLDLRTEGRTMLVSSHLLGEVEQVCDQVVIINDGRVMASGPIASITSGPAAWRLTFSAVDQAERASTLLNEHFVATVTGLEVRAVVRNGSGVAPLEVIMPAGLVPREATFQQPSLEEAYLRLTGAQKTERSE
jgi:ABC-2 type transport system ATP-binding protein